MMIFSDPFLFAISIVDTGAILLLNIYYIITLTDLESDYLNAQECCSKLNFWVTPKMMGHTVLLTLLLFHGHFLLTLINVPMALWLIFDFIKIPKGNFGIYEPTEIHNSGQIKRHLRDCMINMAYYLIIFFVYMYCMINALLEGDPINRIDEDGMAEF